VFVLVLETPSKAKTQDSYQGMAAAEAGKSSPPYVARLKSCPDTKLEFNHAVALDIKPI
jgi:hypothetical protein